jgi:hypothetical protein
MGMLWYLSYLKLVGFLWNLVLEVHTKAIQDNIILVPISKVQAQVYVTLKSKNISFLLKCSSPIPKKYITIY